MIATLQIDDQTYQADLSKPIDISLPYTADRNETRAWYIDPVKIDPVILDGFVGSVKAGGSVNFNNIQFNPHAHGTHTETMGHISEKPYSANEHLKDFFALAQLITAMPSQHGNEWVIKVSQIPDELPRALVVRTVPNTAADKNKNFSNTNPPYFSKEAMQKIVDGGVKHLLVDLPSVDKEVDDGALANHKVFWNYPSEDRLDCSITEFIYVPSKIEDGRYLLNLQMAPFENDATPSRPVLFAIRS